MGSQIQLKSADGHTSTAYLSQPQGAPMGAVVILQEIFGVNSHIRSVADRYAQAGYLAVAPDMFSRAAAETSYHHPTLLLGTLPAPAPSVRKDTAYGPGACDKRSRIAYVNHSQRTFGPWAPRTTY